MSARKLSALAAAVLRQASEPATDEEALVVPTRVDVHGNGHGWVEAETQEAAQHWDERQWRSLP